MRRIVTSAAMVVAFAATAFVTTLPAAADRDDHMGMSSHPRCPRGSHWVPPHRNKHGKWVQGHCRKS